MHRTARVSLTLSDSTSDVSSVRLTNISTAGGKTYVYRMQDNAKWTAGKEYEYAITIE